MKKTTMFMTFAVCFLVNLPGYAQEMPAGNVIVNTVCTLNEGHTFREAVEESRSNDFSADNGPNLIFYRQPIAGGDFPANSFIRTVYWNNMEHWASSAGSNTAQAGTTAQLDEIMSCNNAARSFFVNRNVGEGAAYAGGENDQSLSGAVLCKIRPGNSIADVYQALLDLNTPFAEQGDTSLMQLSHRFLGPQEGGSLGSDIIVRLVGESAVGLAKRLDMSPKNTGTPDDAPVIGCQDMSLWSSHVIHWGI